MIELQSLVWARALAYIDTARTLDWHTLDTRSSRVVSLAARVLAFARDDIELERSSINPADIYPEFDWGCDVVAIDLETTGLDAELDQITEIAVIRCDSRLRERCRKHLYVHVPRDHPSNEWTITHTAWGRATKEEWDRVSVSPEAALDLIAPLLVGAAPLAHFLDFETKFLRHYYVLLSPESKAGQWVCSDEWLRDSLDTWYLSSPLRARKIVKTPRGNGSRTLGNVCKALGVKLDRPHDALCDAEACLEVARIILSGEV